MDLQSYLSKYDLSFEEMARRIRESSKKPCTGAAVRNWAAGLRMPEVKFAEAISKTTGGEVTVQALHSFRLAKITSKSTGAAA